MHDNKKNLGFKTQCVKPVQIEKLQNCVKKVAFSSVCSMTTSQTFNGTFPLSSYQDSAFDPVFFPMNRHIKEMKKY